MERRKGENISIGINEKQSLVLPTIGNITKESVKPHPLISRLNEVRAITDKHFQKAIALAEEKTFMTKFKESINSTPISVSLFKQLSDQPTSKQEGQPPLQQEKLLIETIGKEVEVIRIEYEQLLQEIFKDGTLLKEIRDFHLQTEIFPLVNNLLKEKKITKEQKQRFYTALNNYLQHADGSEEQRQFYKKELEQYFFKTNGGITSDLYHLCFPLINGKDKQIIQEMVAYIAAEKISLIKDTVELSLESDKQKQDFERVLITNIDSSGNWLRDENSFGFQLISKLHHLKYNFNHPYMNMWRAFKSSCLANELFTTEIRKQDKEMYEQVLEGSFSNANSGYIDMLYYYPTPEAIRNLVLLAAADKNYQTINVNYTLNRLSKRPDWQQILDAAEKKYPLLGEVREILAGWNYREYNNHPNIKKKVESLAFSLFQETATDKRLNKLSALCLSNEMILNILGNREILSEQEVQTLMGTMKFLKEKFEKRQTNIEYQSITSQYFYDGLRNNLLYLLLSQKNKINPQYLAVTQRFYSLSRLILENKEDMKKIKYLISHPLITRLTNSFSVINDLDEFFNAYKKIPELLSNHSLFDEFCKQYRGKQTETFFREIIFAYQGYENQRNMILDLVRTKAITQETALTIPKVAKNILDSPNFWLAITFPKLYFETNDSLEFANKTTNNSIFLVPNDLDVRIGKRIRVLQNSGDLEFSALLAKIAATELARLEKILLSDEPDKLAQLKWQQLLIGYVRANSTRLLPDLPEIWTDKINALFKDTKVRNMCLDKLRNQWLNYLRSQKLEEIPFSLIFISEFINYCGGVGVLSQINSLNNLISSVNLAFVKELTVERTKLEISQGLVMTEERFTKEKWSNEDRTDFYNISTDIINTAPSIFSDYLSLFKKLSPVQLRRFIKEIYPLYRTKLVLIEKINDEGTKSFDRDKLINLRRDVRDFSAVVNVHEDAFATQKIKLFAEITNLFQERFGIIKIPEMFTAEDRRTLINISTYLTNLPRNRRTANEETILGFYLSLMLNKRWDDFRMGREIDPDEFLVQERSEFIKKFLQERQRLNSLTADKVGILPEEIPEFYRILQQETSNVVLGNLQTLDLKLTNIILNLRGLEDLELYTDPLDKQKMQLLLDYDSKKIGTVVAKMYQQLVNPAKRIELTQKDNEIKNRIIQIIQDRGLTFSSQTLREHFQEGIRSLSTVINLMSFIAETEVEAAIKSLQNLLKPSNEIITIFKKLGEDLKPTSGIITLAQNLGYWDNLILKKENELEPKEVVFVKEYIHQIKDQMSKLENIYEQIKNKVYGLRKSNILTTNPILKDKIDEINSIIHTQSTQQTIISTMTNNLNIIIENIRECLSCKREGCNNDTNLTFGDLNKFYLFSQFETQQLDSIADELVFVEPITREDGSESIAFVLDKIYGTKTPTVLYNHIEVTLKKQKVIKQKFPKAKISVFVPLSTITTGATSVDMLLTRFREKNIVGQLESIDIDVAASAAGDHYIEFSPDARTAGRRKVNGVLFLFE